MSRGTPTTPFRIEPSLKRRAQARAARENTTLTHVVITALEVYAADEPDPTPEEAPVITTRRRRSMSRGATLAIYLREQARWRADKTDEYDDKRNTRSAIALLKAADYIEQLPDDDSRLVRLDAAHCL